MYVMMKLFYVLYKQNHKEVKKLMNKIRRLKQHLLENNNQTKIIIAIGMIALLLVAFYSFKSKTVVKGKSAGDLKPAVDVITVTHRDMMKNIILTGKTVPISQVDIVAKYGGKITQVNVDLGQKVSQGQELIIQDHSDVNILLAQNGASLRQANADAIESNASFEASYQKAQADYQYRLTNYGRYKALFDQGAISKENLDNQQQLVTAAQAAVDIWSKQMASGSVATVASKQAASDKAQSVVDALQNQKNDLVLRAPRAGVIGYRQAEVGALAQTGQKLLSIVDNSNIFVDCSVSEQDIGQIVMGMPTNISIESLGKSYTGKIVYISPAMDTATQSFTIRIALDNLDNSIKTGMFARTNIDVVLRPQTLFVPKEAVLSTNGKDRVFVVDGNSKVTERAIKLGLRNDKGLEILSGINEGEQVAVTNLSRLKTGTTIVPNAVGYN